MQTFVLCLEVGDGKQETREWGVANLTGSRDGEGCRRSEEEHVSSPLPHPRLFRALLTGGAWLVMSREVARLAGTNRLPPLIVYDVAIPPPPTSISPSALHLSVSLSLYPSLPVFMGSLWFIQGSVEVRATESRGVFYFSWRVKRLAYSIPVRRALSYQDWLIHLEWPRCLASSRTLVIGRL